MKQCYNNIERCAYGCFIMFFIKCVAIKILFMAVLRISNAQRKIKDGQKTQEFKKYMVYLLKATESPRKYDEWLCGGAIVTDKIIVTSAACVTDVEYMYAIAGYNKYVKLEDIDTNECTKHMKKKVVRSCMPMGYEFSYEKAEKWSQIDIAIVEVETPFTLKSSVMPPSCSHSPDKIDVNYDYKYQKPNTDVFMLGWGHSNVWRKPEDNRDLNTELLIYGSTLILEKEKCKAVYSEVKPDLLPIIDKYMICTLEPGILNDKGELFEDNPRTDKDGCSGQIGRSDINCEQATLRKSGNLSHLEHNIHSKSISEVIPTSNKSSESFTKQIPLDKGMRAEKEDAIEFAELLGPNATENSSTTINYIRINKETRKQGICQNDHGGPLITWRGSKELLIGIASVFTINEKSECIGPYLFTSTHCNSMFLDCVINGGKHIKRMGTNDYVVGSGPDPAYDEHVHYYDENEQVFDGRRGISLDISRMAPACQRTAAEMGFKFEFRRINWDKLNTGSNVLKQMPKIKDHKPNEDEAIDEIRIRPQIPLAQYAAGKTKVFNSRKEGAGIQGFIERHERITKNTLKTRISTTIPKSKHE